VSSCTDCGPRGTPWTTSCGRSAERTRRRARMTSPAARIMANVLILASRRRPPASKFMKNARWRSTTGRKGRALSATAPSRCRTCESARRTPSSCSNAGRPRTAGYSRRPARRSWADRISGPGLRAFILYQHHHCHVKQPKLHSNCANGASSSPSRRSTPCWRLVRWPSRLRRPPAQNRPGGQFGHHRRRLRRAPPRPERLRHRRQRPTCAWLGSADNKSRVGFPDPPA
jgi:hypothetical protein